MDMMQRISVKLIYSNPFYGHLMMQARKVKNDNLKYAMAVGVVDGMIEIEYNQDILEKFLDENNGKWEYLCAVAEHELLHVIFKHFMRRQDRNEVASLGGQLITIWNMAGDIAINQLIEKPLPGHPLSHDLFNMPANLTAEQYYDKLLSKAKSNGSHVCTDMDGNPMSGQGDLDEEGNWQGNGGDWDDENADLMDDHSKWRDVESDDSKGTDQENAIIRNAVEKAKKHAKRIGKMPSSIEEAINKILEPPVVPWNKILRRFIGDSFKVGHSYTWKRPSRRFGSTQKGKKAIKSLKIICVIDTSGSIGDEEFNIFISEITSIRNSYPTEIHIIEVDAAVQKVYKLRKEVDVKFKGRGGTRFEPAFEYVKDHRMQPGLLVYLTDLAGSFPDKAPPYPVIWVKTPDRYGWSKDEVPFGRVIKIDDSHRRAA